jgi:DNA-binding MarR family transcriptional regulator
MALLSVEPNTSVAELARREAVAHPTISRLITTLEKAKLVRRTPDPNDGRSSLVSLTKEGDQLYDDVAARRERLFELLLAQLSPATIQEVLDLVDRSATSIEDALRKT